MKRPYLIQRGSFKKISGPATGFDMLVNLDYMGSAEFEFGNIPNSMKRICERIEHIQMIDTGFSSFDHLDLYVICVNDVKDLLQNYVEFLVTDHIHLKERTNLKESINGIDSIGRHVRFDPYIRTMFWWDIENDWMLVLGESNAKNVVTGVKKVAERKRASK